MTVKTKRICLFSVLALLLAGLLCFGIIRIFFNEKEIKTVRLMSFNTQHCLNYRTKKIDFELMADTIRAEGGEIVGLQEMRGKGADADYTDQTKKLADLLGYEYYFAKALDVGGKNPYGNAILSKYPILSAETVPIPDPDPRPKGCETRCILKAVIDVGEPLTVLVTHFGLSAEEQQSAVDTVVKEIGTEKCVLMGDFNVTPQSKVLKPIRERMTDTSAFFEEEKYSFPSDKPTKRIDYLFVSADVTVTHADIPHVVASDHCPYICDIQLP